MKTGKEIVENWSKHSEPGVAYLIKKIDAALLEARLEGELIGWKNAKKMVDAMLGKNNQ